MSTSPNSAALAALHQHGQSPWLDFIHRQLIQSGELSQWIAQGVRGLTSNPAIFDKALASGSYDTAVAQAMAEGLDSQRIYEQLAIEDIRAAADAFLPLHQASAGVDGWVSLEVSPMLAHDSTSTVVEARRLWQAVDRPNLMIKVPGTPAGLQALRQLINDGISVNVTLLFSVDAYVEVVEAWMQGLEARARSGASLAGVASVASFFISRIDAVVDAALANTSLSSLAGKVAMANAALAYAHLQQLLSGTRWQRLQQQGASVQRLLWASTGTKNPAYAETLYVEGLIAAHTVNTMPPATLQAFVREGRVAPGRSGFIGVLHSLPDAEAILRQLPAQGIDLHAITTRLQQEGIAQFEQSFAALLARIESRRAA